MAETMANEVVASALAIAMNADVLVNEPEPCIVMHRNSQVDRHGVSKGIRNEKG